MKTSPPRKRARAKEKWEEGWMEYLNSRDDGISYGVRWRRARTQSHGWDSRSRVQIEFLFLGHFSFPRDSSAQLQTPPTEKMERSGMVVRRGIRQEKARFYLWSTLEPKWVHGIHGKWAPRKIIKEKDEQKLGWEVDGTCNFFNIWSREVRILIHLSRYLGCVSITQAEFHMNLFSWRVWIGKK